MSTTMTSAEQWLRDSVGRQLNADPSFDASMIGVTSSDGVVTLSGYVDTYFARLAAERAARRVYGVKAVAAWTVSGVAKVINRIGVVP